MDENNIFNLDLLIDQLSESIRKKDSINWNNVYYKICNLGRLIKKENQLKEKNLILLAIFFQNLTEIEDIPNGVQFMLVKVFKHILFVDKNFYDSTISRESYINAMFNVLVKKNVQFTKADIFYIVPLLDIIKTLVMEDDKNLDLSSSLTHKIIDIISLISQNQWESDPSCKNTLEYVFKSEIERKFKDFFERHYETVDDISELKKGLETYAISLNQFSSVIPPKIESPDLKKHAEFQQNKYTQLFEVEDDKIDDLINILVEGLKNFHPVNNYIKLNDPYIISRVSDIYNTLVEDEDRLSYAEGNDNDEINRIKTAECIIEQVLTTSASNSKFMTQNYQYHLVSMMIRNVDISDQTKFFECNGECTRKAIELFLKNPGQLSEFPATWINYEYLHSPTQRYYKLIDVLTVSIIQYLSNFSKENPDHITFTETTLERADMTDKTEAVSNPDSEKITYSQNENPLYYFLSILPYIPLGNDFSIIKRLKELSVEYSDISHFIIKAAVGMATDKKICSDIKFGCFNDIIDLCYHKDEAVFKYAQIIVINNYVSNGLYSNEVCENVKTNFIPKLTSPLEEARPSIEFFFSVIQINVNQLIVILFENYDSTKVQQDTKKYIFEKFDSPDIKNLVNNIVDESSFDHENPVVLHILNNLTNENNLDLLFKVLQTISYDQKLVASIRDKILSLYESTFDANYLFPLISDQRFMEGVFKDAELTVIKNALKLKPDDRDLLIERMLKVQLYTSSNNDKAISYFAKVILFLHQEQFRRHSNEQDCSNTILKSLLDNKTKDVSKIKNHIFSVIKNYKSEYNYFLILSSPLMSLQKNKLEKVMEHYSQDLLICLRRELKSKKLTNEEWTIVTKEILTKLKTKNEIKVLTHLPPDIALEYIKSKKTDQNKYVEDVISQAVKDDSVELVKCLRQYLDILKSSREEPDAEKQEKNEDEPDNVEENKDQ